MGAAERGAAIGGKSAPHFLVFPLWMQGHYNPMLRLAKQMARSGVSITFLLFESLDFSPSLDVSEFQEHEFRFLLVPSSEPLPNIMAPSKWEAVHRDTFMPVIGKLVHDSETSGNAGPTAILSDMFIRWTQDAAEEFHLSKYTLITSGVNFAKLMYEYANLYGKAIFRSETDPAVVYFDGTVCFPDLPPLRYFDLPRSLRVDAEEFFYRCKSLRRSDGVLVNSFYELEEKIVNIFRKLRESPEVSSEVPKIYTIGPLFPTLGTEPSIKPGSKVEDSAGRCLQWLDSQPPSSVIYIAFGSYAKFSTTQIHELAVGLEKSNQRFLWVLPRDSSVASDGIPTGFQARMGDRGFIINGWAPQLEILAHKSTGAFITHCGWNSSLEGILSGVPLIAWPQTAEQFLNCRYLVDELKVAKQLEAGPFPENIVDHGEVEKVLLLLMEKPEGKKIKEASKQMKNRATAAISQGGSSSQSYHDFLHDIGIPS